MSGLLRDVAGAPCTGDDGPEPGYCRCPVWKAAQERERSNMPTIKRQSRAEEMIHAGTGEWT